MPIRSYGLTHIALASPDPHRAARFYGSVFGCKVVYDDGDFIQVQTPGTRDVIVFMRSDKSVGKMGGVAHLGFRLHDPRDIHAAADAVKAAGGSVTEQGEFAPGVPYLFATDLDGYTIEIWYELPTPLDPR